MLFYPWREEDALMGACDTFEERYYQILNENNNEVKMKYYNHHSVSLENAMEDIQKQDDPDDAWDVVAPCTQSAEREDMDEGDRQAPSSLALAPPRNIQADIGVDLGLPVLPEHQEDLLINYIPDDDYYTILRTLNSKQRQFFLHILHFYQNKRGANACLSHWWRRCWKNCICQSNSSIPHPLL